MSWCSCSTTLRQAPATPPGTAILRKTPISSIRWRGKATASAMRTIQYLARPAIAITRYCELFHRVWTEPASRAWISLAFPMRKSATPGDPGVTSRAYIIAGTTGSGKSTTLKNLMEWMQINRYDNRGCFLTVEDPVEYQIYGATQSSVLSGESGGFHSAIKSSLRRDPDVLMVGEIRDNISSNALAG